MRGKDLRAGQAGKGHQGPVAQGRRRLGLAPGIGRDPDRGDGRGEHGFVREGPADSRELRLVKLRVEPGQDETLGRGQGREGLSQRSPGQEITVPEGRGRVQQHQVQVPVQLKMLEAVVQQKEVRPKLLPGGQARGITAGPGINRHPGQGPGQPVRLFPHLGAVFGKCCCPSEMQVTPRLCPP